MFHVNAYSAASEIIPIQKINSYERLLNSDVQYRFTINIESLE